MEIMSSIKLIKFPGRSHYINSLRWWTRLPDYLATFLLVFGDYDGEEWRDCRDEFSERVRFESMVESFDPDALSEK
mgnify:CR=1 FL=1